MGIVIDVDPTIVHLGPVALRWYGLLFALGIMSGAWLGLREARRKGLDEAHLGALLTWGVLGGLAGARLFHVIDRWDTYASDPLGVLAFSRGGLAVYGGLVGGSLAVLLYAWRHGLPVWRLADAAAPGLILGQAVGRLACIPNGDALGAPTDLPWAFVYTNPDSTVPAELLGVPTQPYVVYEIIFDLGLLALLWRLRTVYSRDGLLFLTYAGAYSVGRFFLSYVRTERVWLWGLQEAQLVAVLTLAVALLALLWRLKPREGWRISAANDPLGP